MYAKLLDGLELKGCKSGVNLIYFKSKEGYAAFPINGTAFEILTLCDGTKKMEDIISEMKNKYPDEDNVFEIVDEFINSVISQGIVQSFSKPVKDATIIKNHSCLTRYSPQFITVEITDKCHMKCEHCYVEASNKNYNHMHLDTFKSIVDYAQDMGIRRLEITGGEIFLHPQIDDILKYVFKNFKREIYILTSGTLVSNDFYNILFPYIKEERISLQVSLDGPPHFHDKFRGVDGSFNAAISFLKNISDLGFNVYVSTTISSQSLVEIEELIEKVKKEGLPNIRFGKVMDLGNATENNVKVLDRKEFNEIITKMKNKYDDENFKVMFLDTIPKDEHGEYCSCGAGSNMLAVKCDGEIMPCITHEFSLGKIKHGGQINDILDKFAKIFIDSKLPSTEICGDCHLKNECFYCSASACTNSKSVKNCKWKEQFKEVLL